VAGRRLGLKEEGKGKDGREKIKRRREKKGMLRTNRNFNSQRPLGVNVLIL